MTSHDDTKFEQQFARIVQIANVQTDTALARILGISPVSVCNAKTRKSIPMAWFVTIRTMFGVSLDWLVYGTDKTPTVTNNKSDDEIRQSIGLKYADTCGNCYRANGKHLTDGLEAWHCMKHHIEVFGHQVCPNHTTILRN